MFWKLFLSILDYAFLLEYVITEKTGGAPTVNDAHSHAVDRLGCGCRYSLISLTGSYLVQRESNPHRFLRANFRPYFVIALVKPERLPRGQCLVRAKIRSVKTALHI